MLLETKPATARKTNRAALWVALIAAGLILSFSAGFTLRQTAASNVDAQLAAVRVDMDATKVQIAGLQKELADKDAQLASLQENASKVTALQSQVAVLNKQLSYAKSGGSNARLSQIADSLANDRLLLVEFRKDAPKTRVEARTYWASIKSIAIKSNAMLGPMADRVIGTIDPYFAWSQRNYPSADDKAVMYSLTGANVYEDAERSFWNAVMKVAIDRMDAVSTTVP